MTTTLSPRPHHNVHVLDGAARPVLVQGMDHESSAPDAPRAWVYYGGEGGSGDAAVTYSVPVADLRPGGAATLRLGPAQADVARYRFVDVRDGSPEDDTLGADLDDDGCTLRVGDVADALATLDAALDIVATWCGPDARREQRATARLRGRLAALANGA